MKILYSTNCPRCSILEKKMRNCGFEFTISDDMEEVVNQGFTSAPVVFDTLSNKWYTFEEMIDYINSKER